MWKLNEKCSPRLAPTMCILTSVWLKIECNVACITLMKNFTWSIFQGFSTYNVTNLKGPKIGLIFRTQNIISISCFLFWSETHDPWDFVEIHPIRLHYVLNILQQCNETALHALSTWRSFYLFVNGVWTTPGSTVHLIGRQYGILGNMGEPLLDFRTETLDCLAESCKVKFDQEIIIKMYKYMLKVNIWTTQ